MIAEVSHYDVGATYERLATFKVNGVLTDPATVTAKVRNPITGTVADYTYPSANLLRDSVGVFRLTGVATDPGRWYYRIVGTGAAAGVAEDYFIVDASTFDLIAELAAYALTTIEDVELYMDRVGVQGSRGSEADELRFIASLINAKSAAILAYTRRQFKPTENAATKKFLYDGSGRVLLAPYELRTLTTARLYTDRAESAWRTLQPQTASAEAEYTLEPRQRTVVGTYLSLILPRLGRGDYEVSIIGDWGAGIVPADVKQICEAEVKAEWDRSTSRDVGIDIEDRRFNPSPFDLSYNSRAALDRHAVKRPRAGSLELR